MWIIFCPFLGGIGLPKSPEKAQKRRWGREVKRSKEEWDLIGMQGGVSVTRLVLQNLRLDNHLKFQLQPEFISLSLYGFLRVNYTRSLFSTMGAIKSTVYYLQSPK